MPNDFHPIADLFPLMADAELAELAADIKANGLREPVWLHRDGRIIDGRNRWRACEIAGVECPSRTFEGEGDELVRFVLSVNLHRRHLSESQRAMVASKLATLADGQKKLGAQICAPSQDEAADLVNVSRRSVQHARVVRTEGTAELIAGVERGEVPVSKAASIVRTAQPAEVSPELETAINDADLTPKAAAEKHGVQVEQVRRGRRLKAERPDLYAECKAKRMSLIAGDAQHRREKQTAAGRRAGKSARRGVELYRQDEPSAARLAERQRFYEVLDFLARIPLERLTPEEACQISDPTFVAAMDRNLDARWGWAARFVELWREKRREETGEDQRAEQVCHLVQQLREVAKQVDPETLIQKCSPDLLHNLKQALVPLINFLRGLASENEAACTLKVVMREPEPVL